MARSLPAEYVRSLKFGEPMLVAHWLSDKVANKDRKVGRTGVARIFGYFIVDGVNYRMEGHPDRIVAARLRILERLDIVSTEEYDEPQEVERECGSYSVGAVSYVRNTIKEIVDIVLEESARIGVVPKFFATGHYVPLDHEILLEPVGFTRTLLKVDIDMDLAREPSPSGWPPAVVRFIYDYGSRRYISRKARAELDRVTGGVTGNVTP